MSNEIKRIGKGQLVKTTDSQVVGRVVSWTDEEITVAQAGNNFEVTFSRDEMVRATKEEYAQAEDAHFKELEQADQSDEVEVEHPLAKIRKYKYEVCLSASGKKSKDNADEVAIMLRGKTLDEVYEIAESWLIISAEELKARYAHLNAGQQRMNVGNRLRAYIKKERNQNTIERADIDAE